MPDVKREVAAARDAVAGASSVVALTGAGISTDSGIPDFRGPQGVWTKNPGAERTATIQHYVSDPAVRRGVWQSRLHSPAWTAEPNQGHLALVDLERQGRLGAIVTQNIDGMHQRAGSNPDRVIEVHGTMREVVCLRCGAKNPMEPTLARVRGGDLDPRCLAYSYGWAGSDGSDGFDVSDGSHGSDGSDGSDGFGSADGSVCGGLLKSATISFGQALDPDVMERAICAVAGADLLLVIGSTLTVYPAAALVPHAAAAGTPIVIVNADPTPFDGLAAAVVRTPISEALPALVAEARPGRPGELGGPLGLTELSEPARPPGP